MKVGKDEADSKGLIKHLRSFCETFGVPEEISTDGQSSYVSQETKEFLKAWGITRCRLHTMHIATLVQS